MTEVGVVVDRDGSALYWHLPPGREENILPDDRALWDLMWRHREQILGFAHSHPGRGRPSPSWTDLTTFAAIEAALGRRWVWWITSADRVVSVVWGGRGNHDYTVLDCEDSAFAWLSELRERSTSR